MINPFMNGLQLVYYINTHIVCVSVCVSVMSELSGTGDRSAELLAPTWRASLGELQRLANVTVGQCDRCWIAIVMELMEFNA